jgi:hypothetical protein
MKIKQGIGNVKEKGKKMKGKIRKASKTMQF